MMAGPVGRGKAATTVWVSRCHLGRAMQCEVTDQENTTRASIQEIPDPCSNLMRFLQVRRVPCFWDDIKSRVRQVLQKAPALFQREQAVFLPPEDEDRLAQIVKVLRNAPPAGRCSGGRPPSGSRRQERLQQTRKGKRTGFRRQALDEVVVTATRTERLRSQTPVSVTVIPSQEIAASPAVNLDDVLRTQTGIGVKRVVGVASGIPAMISIRGVPSANRTLILVDGMPLNSSGTGFLSLNEIPIGAVERVEIVRGPFSSLYGANAFSGAINVIIALEPLSPLPGLRLHPLPVHVPGLADARQGLRSGRPPPDAPRRV